MSRACRLCGRVKPLEEFPRAGKFHRALCKPCWTQHKSEYNKRWYEKNRHRLADVRRRWHQANKGKANATAAAYRARRNRQMPLLTPAQIAEMQAIYKRARYLTEITGVPHHVDHIYPLKHDLSCGLHVPCNLQVLPGNLNICKSNNLTLDTLAGKRVTSQHVDET